MANLQSVFPKAVNVFGEIKYAERNLWRNVLIVALEDAFALVCHYAGFDHEYVRMKVKKFIKEKNNG
jgi:hypothetical protein